MDIEEGIEKFISEAYWYEGEENPVVDITKRLIKHLDSCGVVRKVDKKVDIESIDIEKLGTRAALRYLSSLYNGFTAWEPLIKEG